MRRFLHVNWTCMLWLCDCCVGVTAGRAMFYVTWPAFHFFHFYVSLPWHSNWIITLTAFFPPQIFYSFKQCVTWKGAVINFVCVCIKKTEETPVFLYFEQRGKTEEFSPSTSFKTLPFSQKLFVHFPRILLQRLNTLPFLKRLSQLSHICQTVLLTVSLFTTFLF